MKGRLSAIVMVFLLLATINTPGPVLESNDKNSVSAKTPSLDILMFGNSYTSNNQLSIRVENTLNQAGYNPNIVSKTSGGKTLDWHGEQAQTNNSDWNSILRDSWDYVILQDQSQVPGFPVSSQYWQDSLSGAEYIDSRVDMKGGDTVFFMTWGYKNGDQNNAWRYPDYQTMQNHLKDGYEMFAENISTEERPAYIAPVGLAFEHIYELVESEGIEPTSDGNSFSNLYASDDSHPSMDGTYLAACVFFASLTGDDPVGLSSTGGISASRALELQQAAAATVFNETPDYIYPWQFEGNDVTFGVQSGSIFNIEPGSTIGVGVNFTNNAEIDTTALISITGPDDWTLSWNEPTSPEVGHSYDAPSDIIQWIQFSIKAPNVSAGFPLANSIHSFSVHLTSDSDGSQDWYNFSMRYGVWRGIELVSGGGSASIDPGGIVNLEVLVRNIGNVQNTLQIDMVPLDSEGNPSGTPGTSFAYLDWTAIIYDKAGLEGMNPGETALVRMQVEAPYSSAGSIDIKYQIWGAGLQEPAVFLQTVIIVPRSGGELGLTNINCNFDVKPGESCLTELFLGNTGDAGFQFNLSITEQPEWLSVNIADENHYLEPGQTVHGIDVVTTVAEGLDSKLTGTVTIQMEVDGWVPAEVSFDVTVDAVHSWEVLRSDSEISDGVLTGYWEIRNVGNGPDGIVVSVDSNVFTNFGVIAPSGVSAEETGRAFEILDVPKGETVIFEVWMEVPDEAPTETQALLTVEVRSVRDPTLTYTVEHSATIAGAPGTGQNQQNNDDPSDLTLFLQRWLQTILIIVVSLIGSVGVLLAIRHRIEKDKEYYEQQNPTVIVEEAEDWIAKFDEKEEKITETIVSPTTDLESFRQEFMEKSGDHSRVVAPAPDQTIIEDAQEVLEEAYVENTINDVIEIADKLQEENITHPDNLILDLDDFDDKLEKIRDSLRDNEDP